jgi:hypothetical protein
MVKSYPKQRNKSEHHHQLLKGSALLSYLFIVIWNFGTFHTRA